MKKRIYVAALAAVSASLLAGATAPARAGGAARCVPVGGTISTNFGVIDEATTLGTYTGDLAGAVSARILEQAPGPNGTVLVKVQHFHVTATGDTVLYEPATMTGKEVAPGRVAVLDYPVRISGGTGRFEGATGKLNAIGEADFNLGQASMRYSGTVCYRD
jgi:hypothetical protein